MKILDVKIDGYTKAELAEVLKDLLKGDKKTKISKLNTEFLYRAIKDKKFLEVLNSSDINIVDGRGIMWAARYLTLPICDNKILRPIRAVWQMIYSGASIVLKPKFITYPIKQTIPGVEALKLMMRTAVDTSSSVFLFGSSEKTLELASANLKKDFPKLKIAGMMNGYDFQKNPKINPVEEINKTDAKLLIVALGCPKQEYWINDNIDKLKNIRVAVGEGGTLDRIANPVQLAPKFVNKIGIEWLWRTLFNKSKTKSRNRFQRFWNAVPAFIHQVIKWKVKNGETKI
jgi:N-acetylglucosaminyldiphosphoundecaprenol N-acetyl-beta-D-mannosaminyltransferase